MKIRNNLRKLMAEKKVKSVMFLSQTLEIPYPTLLNFYHEKYETFNADMIKKLCMYFGCEINELIYLEVLVG